MSATCNEQTEPLSSVRLSHPRKVYWLEKKWRFSGINKGFPSCGPPRLFHRMSTFALLFPFTHAMCVAIQHFAIEKFHHNQDESQTTFSFLKYLRDFVLAKPNTFYPSSLSLCSHPSKDVNSRMLLRVELSKCASFRSGNVKGRSKSIPKD